jgi:hypothetical protein
MGVPGLQTYAESQPAVCYPVDLGQLAQQHRKKVFQHFSYSMKGIL